MEITTTKIVRREIGKLAKVRSHASTSQAEMENYKDRWNSEKEIYVEAVRLTPHIVLMKNMIWRIWVGTCAYQ